MDSTVAAGPVRVAGGHAGAGPEGRAGAARKAVPGAMINVLTLSYSQTDHNVASYESEE
jgi:hypothetical protein